MTPERIFNSTVPPINPLPDQPPGPTIPAPPGDPQPSPQQPPLPLQRKGTDSGRNAQATNPSIDQVDGTLVGYRVVTTHGKAGQVDDPMMDLSKRYLLVSVGRFFRKTRLVPLGVVESVDSRERRVFLNCTTAELKQAPRHGNRETLGRRLAPTAVP